MDNCARSGKEELGLTAAKMYNIRIWAFVAAGLLFYTGLLPHTASNRQGGITQVPVWTDGTIEKLGHAVRFLTLQQADAPAAAASAAPQERHPAPNAAEMAAAADGTIAVALRLMQLAPLKFVSNYVIAYSA